MKKYVISIDQSTQGTKALLFDDTGLLVNKVNMSHRQIVNEEGWVSHDLEEIYKNTIAVVRKVIELARIDKEQIACLGISNQRETTAVWNRKTGKPLDNAIVWQCARAKDICKREIVAQNATMIENHTGLRLSAYFPAAKIAWLLENVKEAAILAQSGDICHGTMDTWLIYKLTHGKSYKTDYSNASRTQLFDITKLHWDAQICDLFGINPDNLPQVCDSDSCFGYTDFDGFLEEPIPICAVMGDSHAALFAQGCFSKGMIKATYGTGSSVMMNIGEKPVLGTHGVVTSLAWSIAGKVQYVMEGNINYAGAVISWLKNDAELIQSPDETEILSRQAIQEDDLYFIPAFTGIGAPYWNSNAKAAFIGISRTTGKSEMVRAAVQSIAYQIADVVEAMEKDTNLTVSKLRVDGGPTKNCCLMQFQSDMLDALVEVSEIEELSGTGAAYLAGISKKIYSYDVVNCIKRRQFTCIMDDKTRKNKYCGWKKAIGLIIS